MSQKYVVYNSEGPDFVFDGELLLDETRHATGRVTVYRTAAGSYVFSQVRTGTGIQPLDRARVFASLEDVPQWLGRSRDAKIILDRLGFQDRVRIE